MALMDERTRQQVRERFAQALEQPVELHLYRRPDTRGLILPDGLGCVTCDAAQELAQELAEAAPDLVRLRVTDVVAGGGEELAVPSLTVGRPGEDPRITFQGLPAGYEFTTLLDAIERASASSDQLGPETASRLAEIEDDVELMVFVTPTCPYCPRAASIANRLALASSKVRSLVIEANEYPELSREFQVEGVPRTVVNRAGAFVGALPEPMFVDSVLQLAAGTAA